MRYVVANVIPAEGHAVSGLYAVLDTTGQKFTSLNLFTAEEALEEATMRNEADVINAHWPDQDDPDVVNLLKCPEYTNSRMTTAYALHRASEAVARQRAGLPVD